MMADLLLFLTDLLFLARIREAADAVGLTYRRATTPEELLQWARQKRPVAIICDLQAEPLQPLRAIAEVKADAALREIRTIGYFSHVRDDVRAHAIRAGCDLVLPRSAFMARLPELLREIAADRIRALETS
jgi:DNA-binding NarL/FixJ family response regulator